MAGTKKEPIGAEALGTKKKLVGEEAREKEIAEKWGQAQWTRLVSNGAVLVARANEVAGWTVKVGLLAAAAGAWTLYSAVGGLPSAPDLAGWKAKPGIEKEWIKGATLPKDMAAFGAAGALTSEPDYAAFVAAVEAGTTRLEPGAAKPSGNVVPCAPIGSLAETWLNPATGVADVPRCKASSDGKTLWVASFVRVSDGDYARPVLGVFHEEKGRRVYRNFDARIAGFHKVAGRETVSFETIPNQTAKDWPGSMTRSEDVTAPSGLWGRYMDKINK